jgi:hypothetical protein
VIKVNVTAAEIKAKVEIPSNLTRAIGYKSYYFILDSIILYEKICKYCGDINYLHGSITFEVSS